MGYEAEKGVKSSKRVYVNEHESVRCWHFGSERGFNLGFIQWYADEHHAEPYWPKNEPREVELANANGFAPWQLSFVGAGNGWQAASSSSSSIPTDPRSW